MSSLDKLVISKPKPYRSALLIITAIILTATAEWFWLQQDNSDLQNNLTFLQQNLNLSRQNSQQLSDERLDLREQNKILNVTTNTQQQEINIQQATVYELQQEIEDLQSQLLSLQKELLFYQTITQGNSSSELQIRELHLTADNKQSDIIHYRLVITQGTNIKTPIKGKVSITIDTDPTIVSEQPLNLRFVQLIEGEFKVTDSEETKLITVTIKRNKKPTLSRTFDWQLTPTINQH